MTRKWWELSRIERMEIRDRKRRIVADKNRDEMKDRFKLKHNPNWETKPKWVDDNGYDPQQFPGYEGYLIGKRYKQSK